jgi:hypothetical protein
MSHTLASKAFHDRKGNQSSGEGKEQAVRELVEVLRIRASRLTRDRKGDRKAAEWLRPAERGGREGRLNETEEPDRLRRAPRRQGRLTILIYGHDVQPPDPLDEWESPPFEPVVKDGKVFARGSSDDKGQLLTHVNAIRAWLEETGSLPINVKVIFEGGGDLFGEPPDLPQEEPRQVEMRPRHRLKHLAVRARILQLLMVKGLTYVEVRVRAERRSPLRVVRGSVANPANVLAKLIASMHDDKVASRSRLLRRREVSEDWSGRSTRSCRSTRRTTSRSPACRPWGEDGYDRRAALGASDPRRERDVGRVHGGRGEDDHPARAAREGEHAPRAEPGPRQDHSSSSTAREQVGARPCGSK